MLAQTFDGAGVGAGDDEVGVTAGFGGGGC